jgi:hypothetical protein
MPFLTNIMGFWVGAEAESWADNKHTNYIYYSCSLIKESSWKTVRQGQNLAFSSPSTKRPYFRGWFCPTWKLLATEKPFFFSLISSFKKPEKQRPLPRANDLSKAASYNLNISLLFHKIIQLEGFSHYFVVFVVDVVVVVQIAISHTKAVRAVIVNFPPPSHKCSKLVYGSRVKGWKDFQSCFRREMQ